MYRALPLAFLCLTPLLAQWIHLPTPDIPRTRDGKANLAAPPPKTRDGKPDLSGMWWSAGPTLPCPDSMGGAKDCAEKGLGLKGQQGSDLPVQAMNIGASLPDGLPYTPLGADLAKQHAADPLNDPHTRCIPSYVPRGYTLPHILKFIQTPSLLIVGVDTGIHWQPGHWFSLFKDLRRGDLSVTDRVGKEILSLPLHSCMSVEDRNAVVEGVASFFGAARRPAIAAQNPAVVSR